MPKPQTKSVDFFRGIESEVTVLNQKRNVGSAESIINWRFGSLWGGIERVSLLGGSAEVYQSAIEHILGLADARYSTIDELITFTDKAIYTLENNYLSSVYFLDSGLDDMTVQLSTSPLSNSRPRVWVEVDATGTPDTFKWGYGLPASETEEASGVSMTGGWQTLVDEIRIKFDATTGHTLNDKWEFSASANKWVTDRISRQAYTPGLDITERYSHGLLNNKLIFTDFANSELEEWSGSGLTAALTIGSLGEKLGARYIKTVQDFIFLGHVKRGATWGAATTYSSEVRWSSPGDPEDWPTNSFWTIGKADGDIVMGLSSIGNSLIAFKRNSIYRGLYSGPDVEWVFDVAIPNIGCIAPFSIIEYNNFIYFIGGSGVFIWDGISIPENISGVKVSGRIVNAISSMGGSYDMVGVKHPSRPEIWFASPGKPTIGEDLWIYNIDKDDWGFGGIYDDTTNECPRAFSVGRISRDLSFDDLKAEGIEYTFDSIREKPGDVSFDGAFAGTPEEWFFWGNNIAQVKWDQGTYIGGAYTGSIYLTSPEDCGEALRKKRFMGLRIKVVPEAVTLGVRVLVDGVEKKQKTLTMTSGPGKVQEHSVDFDTIGYRMQVEFTNDTDTENPVVLGYDIQYLVIEKE